MIEVYPNTQTAHPTAINQSIIQYRTQVSKMIRLCLYNEQWSSQASALDLKFQWSHSYAWMVFVVDPMLFAVRVN